MIRRTLLMLLLFALAVRAQIAVSANVATEILVDGVRVMVANPPPGSGSPEEAASIVCR